MSKLTNKDVMSVKANGFLRNRGTDKFSMRISTPGTVFTAEDFVSISELSKKYGNGKVICTSRLGVEIPGIDFDKIPEAMEFAKKHGIRFGGTGAKIRPIAACKGSTCVFGNCDTHAIAKKIDENYFVGWTNVKLPHKFKICVGGCPNSCMKPSLNDFGVEGHRVPTLRSELCRACNICAVEQTCPVKAANVVDGRITINEKCIACGACIGKCPFEALERSSESIYKIFVGGTWGKTSRNGTPLSRYFSEDEIYPILEKTILWFKKNAYAKERLGKAIDRIGFDIFEKEVLGDSLLLEKDEIISSEIKNA